MDSLDKRPILQASINEPSSAATVLESLPTVGHAMHRAFFGRSISIWQLSIRQKWITSTQSNLAVEPMEMVEESGGDECDKMPLQRIDCGERMAIFMGINREVVH